MAFLTIENMLPGLQKNLLSDNNTKSTEMVLYAEPIRR